MVTDFTKSRNRFLIQAGEELGVDMSKVIERAAELQEQYISNNESVELEFEADVLSGIYEFCDNNDLTPSEMITNGLEKLIVQTEKEQTTKPQPPKRRAVKENGDSIF